MAWVRIHDGAMSHPKIIGMFDWRDPFHVWVWGLSQSQMHLTDGFLTAASVPRMGRKAAQELVDRALWEVVDGGWKVHDFLDWNDDRVTIRTRQEQSKTRSERFRQRVTNSKKTDATTLPIPSQTIPDHEKSVRAAHTTSGAMAGMLPRDHLRHAVCGRICLHEKQFAEFAAKIGGDLHDAKQRVYSWAKAVLDEWGEDGPKRNAVIQGDTFAWWNARYVEWQGSPKAAQKAAQSVLSGGNCPHVPRCARTADCIVKTVEDARQARIGA